MRTAILGAAIVVTGAMAGCATSAVESDFGKSVQSMEIAQVANPATLTTPSTAAVTGVDQEYSQSVLTTMRKSNSSPDDVGKPITIVLPGGK